MKNKAAQMNNNDQEKLAEAYEQALKGLKEGGIPIGSVLVQNGETIGKGHNKRIQEGSAVLHGEMDAIENAGRLSAADYQACTIYTTLSPCPMCSGMILLYKIPRVVIGENSNFMGEEELLKSRGVEVVVLDDERCKSLMRDFIEKNSVLWNEDIGV
ncbi:MAG: nucleoside deaminase [Lewinella sp.]|nr:nucleoside deaminase [Lewinella sp.]